MRKYTAEFMGTFAMVFAGTGAMVVNDVTQGTVTHVGISLTWGLVVLAMIYAVGDISGAHFNPAVTIAFAVAGRFPRREVLPYLGSQFAGALVASAVVHLLFPEHATLGMTLPRGSDLQAFVFEFILTYILMFVILNISTGAKEKGTMAGIAVGAVIGLEALFAGPICGASMNPARSLAPALVAFHFQSLWLYLVAPILGALSAVAGCKCIQATGCCAEEVCA